MVFGQTKPGGTNLEVELWLKADDITTVAIGDEVTTWNDVSGNGRHFAKTGSVLAPLYSASSFNFNPSLEFPLSGLDSDDEEQLTLEDRRRKLQSTANFPVTNTKSYYVFWVSQVDVTNSDGRSAVFALNHNRDDNFGWRINSDDFMLWNGIGGNSGSSSVEHSKANYLNFGIGSSIIANNSTNQQFFHNGYPSTNVTNSNLASNGGRLAIIGNSENGTATDEYFVGDVQEIIVLSTTSKGLIDPAQLNKVHTYLAIKYGMSLSTATQPNYTLSDGTQIWTGSANTGYQNDVFGIARDDQGGLNQKQSVNSVNPNLTVFLGTTLHNLNRNNTTNFAADKQAVVLGSNGLSGITNYAKPVGTVFQNYTLQGQVLDENNNPIVDPETGLLLTEEISHRFSNIQKVQITGASSYVVSLNPLQGQWVLISSDPTFPNLSTRIYKVDSDGIVENITLNNGDYISFASYIKAPAGVAEGLVMWLNASKTSSLTINEAENVTRWVDFSGNGTSYSKILDNTTEPGYLSISEKMNYHPAVNFRRTNQREYLSTLKGPFSVAQPNSYTFFTAVNATNSNDRFNFASYGRTRYDRHPGIGIRERDGKYRGSVLESGAGWRTEGSTNLFDIGATTSFSHTMKYEVGWEFYGDGHKEFVEEEDAGTGSRMNGSGTLGTGSFRRYNLQGVMGEHIAYEGSLSDVNRNKIDSYLGLKYGITIDLNKSNTTTNFDYILSDGKNIWPGTTNTTFRNYHRNVASVVIDRLSDLVNLQSKSTGTGALLHMGIGEKLGLNPDLEEFVGDKIAITWGHNGQSFATTNLSSNTDICGDLDSKLTGRIWLVNNSGFDQPITVKINDNNTVSFPYSGSSYQVYMLVADTAAKFAANNWDYAIPMTHVDGGDESNVDDGHQVSYTFPKDQIRYISFGAKQISSTCETCEFEGRKRLDFSDWTDGDVSETIDLGESFTANVNITTESGITWVGDAPHASDNSSLREYRRGSIALKTTNKITLSKAAVASFEIYEISRRSGRLDEVEIYGICGGRTIYPNLSYSRSESGSSFDILPAGKAQGYRYSSYSSTRGRMFIEFEEAVTEIYVIHHGSGSDSGTGRMRIGIGPIQFACPQPLPPATEEGLVFTKEADTDIYLCDEVNFIYRIYNNACDPKTVSNFTDTLPDGMLWLGNSLSVNEDNDEALDAAPAYANLSEIILSDIIVPGSGYVTIRAKAYFEEDAIHGEYDTGKAEISYLNLSNTQVTLESCDRYRDGCQTTLVNALETPDRPDPVVVEDFSVDKSCYSSEGIITVTYKVKNTNTEALPESSIEFFYNENFTVVPDSFEVNGSQVTGEVIENGVIYLEDFSLEAGESTFTVKIKAPEIPSPTTDILEIGYDLSLSSSGECTPLVVSDLNDIIELEFCTYCTKPSVGGTALTSNVGISLMKDKLSGWPENVPNGHLVLEAGSKGLVLTRTTPTAIGEANWVEGMIIYNTSSDCISLYDGSSWKCIERSCNE